MMKSNVWQIEGLTMMEKYLLEYMITSPHVNGVGYYHLPINYMVCDTNADRHSVETAIEGLVNKGFVSYDQTRSMIAIANFNRYVTVENGDIRGVNLSFLPPSGVFKTTYAWIKTVYATYDMENFKKKPWVQEALAMPVDGFKKKEIPMLSAPVAVSEEAPAPVVDKDVKAEPEDEVEGTVVEAEEPVHAENEAVPAVTETAEPVAEQKTVEEPAIAEEKAEETVTTVETVATEETPSAEEETKAKKKKAPSDDPVIRQHVEEFEALWKRYPRKVSKKLALDGYLSMIKSGELTFPVASRAVDNYIYQVKKNKTEDQYIIQGNNFFGKTNKRILDFVDTEETVSKEDEEKKVRTKLAPQFKMFLMMYPKKAGVELAEKNFAELVQSGEFTAIQLQDAAAAYASECEAKHTEDQYIKRADTFLDPVTRPFRDYIDREDLNSYSVNLHSGEVEKDDTEDDFEAMQKMVAEEKAKKEAQEQETASEEPKETSAENKTKEEPAEEKSFADAMTEEIPAESSFEGPSVPAYNEDEDDEALMTDDESFDINSSFTSDEDDFPENEDGERESLWDNNWGDSDEDDSWMVE